MDIYLLPNPCLFQRITLRISILLKANFCGTNFPEFRGFCRKSIPKKFSFQGPFEKVDTYKFCSNLFAKINERLVIHVAWIFFFRVFPVIKNKVYIH